MKMDKLSLVVVAILVILKLNLLEIKLNLQEDRLEKIKELFKKNIYEK
tara:strand:- start:5118 stop:5261 length:144 start_codon:yes stop_codon:yes gene_type:complete